MDDDVVAAVAGCLRSDWLTTGPGAGEFERAFAGFVGRVVDAPRDAAAGGAAS